MAVGLGLSRLSPNHIRIIQPQPIIPGFLADKKELVNMTYEETIEKIHSFQKFGSRLGLDRMSRLMELLGNPQNNMKIIHVAGTNGKGSVCRYIYSILQENGYRVGLYTSPFLERFTERIEFNGSEITPDDLAMCTVQVLEKVKLMLQEGNESPTEFEIITAICFVYFEKQDMDFLVLEVGLGGTGDSTNVVNKSVVSVITSISYDHMEYLGDSLEKIAKEKAGIIKQGVPVVFNVEDEDAIRTIKAVARAKECKIYEVNKTKYNIIEKTIKGYTFDTKIEGEEYSRLFISMLGIHQVGNVICALTVIKTLENEKIIRIDKEKVYAGIRKAKQAGRLEILSNNPYVIIDGAHNEAGVEALGIVIREHFPDSKILLIVGMLKDKKIDKLIEKFGLISDEFVATEPDNPRKLSADELCKQVQQTGKRCISIPNAQEACAYMTSNLSSYDVILFAGSLYLIGKVRGVLRDEEKL